MTDWSKYKTDWSKYKRKAAPVPQETAQVDTDVTEDTPEASLAKSQSFTPLESGVVGAGVNTPVIGDFVDEGSGALNALTKSDLYNYLAQKLGAKPEIRDADPVTGEAPEGPGFLENYRTGRDEMRDFTKRAKAANPKSYYAGAIGANLATLPALSAKVPALAKLGGAMALGGVQGLGSGEGDLTKGELLRPAIETTAGVGAGALGYGIGRGLEKGGEWAMKSVAPWMKNTAQGLAVDALRPFKKITNKLNERGMRGELGEDILQSGILEPKKWYHLGKGSEAIQDATDALVKERGAAHNNILDTLQDAQATQPGVMEFLRGGRGASSSYELPAVANGASTPKPLFADRKQIVQSIRDLAGPDTVSKYRPAYTGAVNDVADTMAALETQSIDGRLINKLPMGLKELRDARRAIGDNINYDAANPLAGASAAGQRDARGLISQATKEHADELAGQFAPELKGALAKSDKQMELAFLAQDIAHQRAMADAANREISLTDYMSGIGGNLAVPGFGLGAGLLNKLGRERGAGIAARHLYSAAKKGAELVPNLTTSSKAMMARQGLNTGVNKAVMSLEEYLGLGRPATKEEEDKFANQSFVNGTRPPSN